MSTYVYIFGCTSGCIALCKYLGVKWLSHMASIVLTLWQIICQFLSFYIPTSSLWDCKLLHITTNTCSCWSFQFYLFLWVTHCVLVCIFFKLIPNCSSAIFWKYIFSPIELAWHLCWKLFHHICLGLFLDTLLCFIDVYTSILRPILCCFDYYSVTVIFKVFSIKSSTLSFI